MPWQWSSPFATNRPEGANGSSTGRQLAPGPVRSRGGRGLPLGHAIDLIVHDDAGHIHVAAAGTDKVVTTDG
jgi:hypothetical protein